MLLANTSKDTKSCFCVHFPVFELVHDLVEELVQDLIQNRVQDLVH